MKGIWESRAQREHQAWQLALAIEVRRSQRPGITEDELRREVVKAVRAEYRSFDDNEYLKEKYARRMMDLVDELLPVNPKGE